jgi:hypothetical protein
MVRAWLKRQSAGPNASWLLARVGRRMPVERTSSGTQRNRYVRPVRLTNSWRSRESAA